MLTNPDALIADFETAARIANVPLVPILHDSITAPHKPPALRKGCAAIYVFSLNGVYGARCPAGPNRVIKVGMVGANSGPRFQYQHYSVGSAMSTIASAILRTPVLWSYLGIKEFTEQGALRWLCDNTDRDHFFLPAGAQETLIQLERYLKGRLSPVFEGMSARSNVKSQML